MGCQNITPDATTTINAPLLRQVLAHIEANPQSWVQKEWRCQTGMRFAGWTAELSGGKWAGDPGQSFGDFLVAEPGETSSQGAVPARDRARRLLGLGIAQSAQLFFGENTLTDIRRIVADLIGSVHHVTIRIVPLDELIIGEAMSDGRAPLEVIECRPGLEPMTHGNERGIAAHQLREHARAVADRLGIDYIDPIDPAAMERLTRAEAA